MYLVFLGPALSGFIVHAFGFRAMLYIIAFLCLCYAPLMIFLRNPPGRNENMVKYKKIHANESILKYKFSLCSDFVEE